MIAGEGLVGILLALLAVFGVGDMIDIQYLAIPLNKELLNDENNNVKWYSINELKTETNVDEEIKIKVENLYNDYKNKL